METFWCFVTRGTIESRSSLIYGPFNLVYGLGAVLLTIALYKFNNKNNFQIFLISFIIGSIFEYSCSYFQEKIFGTLSWRYDEAFLNINGRINLMYSIFWGVLGLLWMRSILPFVFKFITKIPKKYLKSITHVLCLFMVFNVLISAIAVQRMSQRKNGISTNKTIETFLDNKYNDEFLKKKYPNMWYVSE